MKCEDQQTESSHDHVTFLSRTTDVPYNYHHNPHKEEYTSKEATAVLVAALEEVTKLLNARSGEDTQALQPRNTSQNSVFGLVQFCLELWQGWVDQK